MFFYSFSVQWYGSHNLKRTRLNWNVRRLVMKMRRRQRLARAVMRVALLWRRITRNRTRHAVKSHKSEPLISLTTPPPRGPSTPTLSFRLEISHHSCKPPSYGYRSQTMASTDCQLGDWLAVWSDGWRESRNFDPQSVWQFLPRDWITRKKTAKLTVDRNF